MSAGRVSIVARLRAGPFQIQCQQTAEDFFFGHFWRVLGPVVGGGLVQEFVGKIELDGFSGQLRVVEVGQRAIF
jgi:hypothetical protein